MMLSAGGHVLAATKPVAAVAPRSPFDAYPTFRATVTNGPHKGLTISGPLLLATNEGRGQVVGYLYPDATSRVGVVGQVFGPGVALRFTFPDGRVIEVSGSGSLVKVRGGFFGIIGLTGSGTFTGGRDRGTWKTVRPTG